MVINFYGVNINLMDYPKLNAEIQKIIVYPFKDNGNTPCFAVVADISTYTETTYKDVYDQKTKKWYKLNNLNQYEQYGVYATPSRLPEGYTELTYISSTSGDFLTDYYGNSNSVYKFKVTPTATKSSWLGIMSVGRVTYSSGMSLYVNNNNSYYAANWNGGGSDTFASLTLNKYVEVEYSVPTLKITNEDGTVVSGTSSNSWNGNSSKPLAICRGYGESGFDNYAFMGKLYYFQVYEGDTLVRNYVPCKNSSGTIGLYETVNGVFLSPSEGSFTAGDVASGGSLDDLTTYVGKLAIYDSHEYKWNGTEWVDLGEMIDNNKYYLSQYQTVNGFEYILPYYWGEGYKMVVYCYFTGGYSGDIGLISNYWSDGICHSPIEFMSYQNGYYYDSHDPISTTSNECNTGDYSNRLYHTGLSFPKDGTKLRFEITYQKVLIYNDETDTLLDTYGSARTGYTWYDGLYIGNFGTRADSSNAKAFTNKVIVYDADGNIVNNCEFKYDATATDAKKLYLYDSVLNARYENNYTGTTALQYAEEEGEPSYPVEYDTKVAPSDNVKYDTLKELELMECPWVGMHATVGDKSYIYTPNNKWEEYDVQSYRYYMWVANSFATNQTRIQYSEFDLGNTSGDFAISAVTGSPVGQTSYGETYEKVYDNNTSTKWLINKSDGSVYYNIFDAGSSVTPTYFSLTTANDSASNIRYAASWSLYGSDSATTYDDSSWVKIMDCTGGDEMNVNYTRFDYQIANYVQYKYIASTDEYVKGDDGKYYQKLYKYGTPDFINWYNTGEYKAGDELETTNIDDGDTTCKDGYLYHYLHVYVIINGNNIATTDYVLGDVIGEATFSIEGTTNATSNFTVKINNTTKTAYIIS